MIIPQIHPPGFTNLGLTLLKFMIFGVPQFLTHIHISKMSQRKTFPTEATRQRSAEENVLMVDSAWRSDGKAHFKAG
jgi:hypothetical protein